VIRSADDLVVARGLGLVVGRLRVRSRGAGDTPDVRGAPVHTNGETPGSDGPGTGIEKGPLNAEATAPGGDDLAALKAPEPEPSAPTAPPCDAQAPGATTEKRPARRRRRRPLPEKKTEGEPGLGLLWPVVGFIVTMIFFLVARFWAETAKEVPPMWKVGLFLVGIMLFFPFLRRCLLWGALVVLLISSGVFLHRNRTYISEGRISLKEGAVGVLEIASGFGPGKTMLQFFGEVRRRQGEKPREVLKPKLPEGFSPKDYIARFGARSPDIVSRATGLVKGCSEEDHVCEATMIHAFVADPRNVRYTSDPVGRWGDGDYPKSPQQTLADGAGDCEDKALLFMSLAGAVGITTYMVLEPGHAHPLVCFDSTLGEELLEAVRLRGRWGIDYLAPYVGGTVTQESLGALFNGVAPPYRIRGQYCYSVESTAGGTWLGVDENRAHEAVLDPISGKAVGG
jgi:hypothetical protein